MNLDCTSKANLVDRCTSVWPAAAGNFQSRGNQLNNDKQKFGRWSMIPAGHRHRFVAGAFKRGAFILPCSHRPTKSRTGPNNPMNCTTGLERHELPCFYLLLQSFHLLFALHLHQHLRSQGFNTTMPTPDTSEPSSTDAPLTPLAPLVQGGKCPVCQGCEAGTFNLPSPTSGDGSSVSSLAILRSCCHQCGHIAQYHLATDVWLHGEAVGQLPTASALPTTPAVGSFPSLVVKPFGT